MSKLSKIDIEAIRDTIKHTGEFRVHLVYSRSGGRVQCRVWHHDGHTVGSASGYGYDKGGAALGQAIELFFAEELKALKAGYEYVKVEGGPRAGAVEGQKVKDGIYGLTRLQSGAMSLDGACGKEQMLKVLVALGFTDCNLYETGKLSSMVLARKPKLPKHATDTLTSIRYQLSREAAHRTTSALTASISQIDALLGEG